jgi:hypothetical protein
MAAVVALLVLNFGDSSFNRSDFRFRAYLPIQTQNRNRAMPDNKVDFSAPATLRKWPSVNKERVSASLGARPYLIIESTLDECIMRFMSQLKSQHHLYEIHTVPQSDNRNDKDFDSAIANIPKCDSFRVKKIDAVLLSVGGNDVGFARLIANAAIDIPEGPLANGRKWAYGLWREPKKTARVLKKSLLSLRKRRSSKVRKKPRKPKAKSELLLKSAVTFPECADRTF